MDRAYSDTLKLQRPGHALLAANHTKTGHYPIWIWLKGKSQKSPASQARPGRFLSLKTSDQPRVRERIMKVS
jgi:hypothetical protein